jgi:aminoglycoside phosphotransferase (APT) family kinase protein
MSDIKVPNEDDAKRILKEVEGKDTKSINRFPTGSANYVYDIETTEGEQIVVRLARSDLKHFFEGALFWYNRLFEKGVPLAKLHYSEIDSQKHGFPTMIMDRLPGEDLGLVYKSLSTEQKKNIAAKIAQVQKDVSTLNEGSGFGYAKSYDDQNLQKKWIDVIDTHLERSRKRIKEIGVIEISIVDDVKNIVHANELFFSTITPICFLDDTTTKNVIINNGELSGIVDVDSVAFGDPLYTVALTRMSLLARDYETDYIDYWVADLDLNKDQKKALDIYTAVFAVDFMSEMGQQFNKDSAPDIDHKKIEKLKNILSTLI